MQSLFFNTSYFKMAKWLLIIIPVHYEISHIKHDLTVSLKRCEQMGLLFVPDSSHIVSRKLFRMHSLCNVVYTVSHSHLKHFTDTKMVNKLFSFIEFKKC
jgi:hypothetical protein